MARKRDVIVGVVIALSFLVAFAFMALMFIGISEPGGGMPFSGLGGDIGIVELYGTINEETGRKAIQQLDEWSENNGIKAIVLHINSPGGGVAISQEVYNAVQRARFAKPVVASMASVAASGGYYVAVAADRVVANPGTMTGSIGVIMQFHTAGEMLDKIGIATETIKSGDLKAVGTYSRPMTEEEDLMLRALVMDSYEQFVEAVATGRNMEKAEVYPVADGSLYTGLQALNLGLVDTLGGLEEAVQLAADLAGMAGPPETVRPLKRRDVTIFDLLQGTLSRISPALDPDHVGPQLLYLYQ